MRGADVLKIGRWLREQPIGTWAFAECSGAAGRVEALEIAARDPLWAAVLAAVANRQVELMRQSKALWLGGVYPGSEASRVFLVQVAEFAKLSRRKRAVLLASALANAEGDTCAQENAAAALVAGML